MNSSNGFAMMLSGERAADIEIQVRTFQSTAVYKIRCPRIDVDDLRFAAFYEASYLDMIQEYLLVIRRS